MAGPVHAISSFWPPADFPLAGGVQHNKPFDVFDSSLDIGDIDFEGFPLPRQNGNDASAFNAIEGVVLGLLMMLQQYMGGALASLALSPVMSLPDIGDRFEPPPSSSPYGGQKTVVFDPPASYSMPAVSAPASAAPPTSEAPPYSAVADPASGGGNQITFINDGAKPMHLVFTPNAGQAQIPDLVLQPSESRTVTFPAGWSGNWHSTAGAGNAYSLGEVAFQAYNGLTFYDDSRIEGSNMGQTLMPARGGRLTGTLDNLLDGAPPEVLAVNTQGQVYGIRKSTVNDIQDPEVVSYLDRRIPLGTGYTYPTDDASTAGTEDTHLIVHMKDFV
jgi:hypothetical protein